MNPKVRTISDDAKKRNDEHPSSATELGRRISALVDHVGGRSKASAIADRSGDQIWKYTRGTAEPPFVPLVRLCQAAGARLDWLATGEGPMLAKDTAASAMSQPLSAEALTMAIQLAAEALDGRSLPPPEYAELVGLIYEGLLDGLPEAKILRFARIGAHGAGGN